MQNAHANSKKLQLYMNKSCQFAVTECDVEMTTSVRGTYGEQVGMCSAEVEAHDTSRSLIHALRVLRHQQPPTAITRIV